MRPMLRLPTSHQRWPGRRRRAPARLRAFIVLALLLFASETTAGSLAYLGRSVFDPASLSVGPTLPLAVRVVHPSGLRAYGVLPGPPGSSGPESVGVLDTLTNTVVATVPLGITSARLALSPSGDRLYVTGTAATVGDPPITLVVIDTATNTEAARLELGAWLSAHAPIVLPAGTSVYVVRADDIAVIDPATNTIRGSIPLPNARFWFPRLHPSGHFLYFGVTNQVAVIDTRVDAIVRTVTLPEGFHLAAIAPRGPDNARLFGIHPHIFGSAPVQIVTVTDAASGELVAELDLGGFAFLGSAFTDPAGTTVYVGLYTCGSPACVATRSPAGIAVIDVATPEVVAVLPSGSRTMVNPVPGTVVPYDPATARLYFRSNEVLLVVDAASRSPVASVPLSTVALTDGVTDEFVFGPGRDEQPGRLSFYVLASTGAASAEQWGAPGDQPVPADYDGDGRADVAVWRPRQDALEAIWYVRRSSDGSVLAQQWGAAAVGDQPVPADYDGDGRVDLAVWRPEKGIWYILRSSDGQIASQGWGAPGDRPVPADYDGDGRADLAVWRDGAWYIVSSRDGSTRSELHGELTDVPVPADYDGDGRADLAVWRPATGEWIIIGSRGDAVIRRQWGAPGDLPVAADYDGDGPADLAVWRASTGEWWIIGSRDGAATRRQWGAAGDVPLPADYNGDGLPDLSVYRP
jgi:DNA-binding beta-propeller fold protein YncE